MSTPSGRPVRPASVFDYAPKRVREQWRHGEANDAADAEFADDPQTRGGPAQADPHSDEGDRGSSLVPKGPHEDHEDSADDAGESEDRIARGWEHGDPEGEPGETRDRRTEDWLDELEHRAELRERRAQAAEFDREYEDQLERLAASLRTLRDEDDGEPERPPVGEARRGRSPYSPDIAERDLYIDGVRLPRFLQASYVPPPPAREGRAGWLEAILAIAIACVVGAPISYYFFAVGNPFASKPRESLTRSEVQYSVASASNRLPKLEQPLADASPANAAGPPAAVAAETAVQAAPKLGAAPVSPAVQAEPSQSPQSPRRVPLTHVVRWPDQAQDSADPPPPRAANVASAPNAAPTSLAFAPIPPQPARPRAAAGDTDEVQLLLKQGQDFVAAGDFATARVVLRRAAEAGAAAAALALAQTYDPKLLAKMRARGVEPDAAEARRWYETAQKLGSGEAAQQLERLARDE